MPFSSQSSLSPSSSKGCTKLFVGGLSFDTTDEKLRAYFQHFGNVATAVVMRDSVLRRSRGFGFVTFFAERSADKALAQPEHHIDGRRVEAKQAVPRDAIAANESPSSSSSSSYSSSSSSSRNSSATRRGGGGGTPTPRPNTGKRLRSKAPSKNGTAHIHSSASSTPSPGGNSSRQSTSGAGRSRSSSNSQDTARNTRSSSRRPSSGSGGTSLTAATDPTRRPKVVPGLRKIFVGGLHYDTSDSTLKA